jgi:hypothetical protein
LLLEKAQMKKWTSGLIMMMGAVMIVGATAGSGVFPGSAASAAGQSRIEEFAQVLRNHPDDVSFGDVVVDQHNQTVEIRDIRMKEPKEGRSITVRSVLFSDVDWDSLPLPHRGKVQVREMKVDIGGSREEFALKLQEAGYDSMLFDLDFKFAYDDAQERFGVDLRFDMRDLGLLTMTIAANGVTKEFWTAATSFKPGNEDTLANAEDALAAAAQGVRIEKIALRYDGPSARIANALPASVQSLTVDVTGGGDKGAVLPPRSRINIRGLTVDVDKMNGKNPALKEILKDMGYQTIQANIDYECTIDEQSQKAETILNVDLPDMGGVRFQLELGGLGPLLAIGASRSLWARGPRGLAPEAWAALGVGALALTVNRASIGYEDHSLTSRSMAATGKRRGLTEEEVRAETLNLMEKQRGLKTEQIERQVMDAALAFIKAPGVITANVRPEPPASYAELAALLLGGNYAELMKRLKLTVESH